MDKIAGDDVVHVFPCSHDGFKFRHKPSEYNESHHSTYLRSTDQAEPGLNPDSGIVNAAKILDSALLYIG